MNKSVIVKASELGDSSRRIRIHNPSASISINSSYSTHIVDNLQYDKPLKSSLILDNQSNPESVRSARPSFCHENNEEAEALREELGEQRT